MADKVVVNDPAPGSGTLTNAAKLVGELAFVPGTSLAMDGDIKGGAMHAGAAVACGFVFGPVIGALTWIATGLNSYSRSVSGQNVYEHFKRDKVAD